MSSASKCTAITKSTKKQCTRNASTGLLYCTQHRKINENVEIKEEKEIKIAIKEVKINTEIVEESKQTQIILNQLEIECDELLEKIKTEIKSSDISKLEFDKKQSILNNYFWELQKIYWVYIDNFADKLKTLRIFNTTQKGSAQYGNVGFKIFGLVGYQMSNYIKTHIGIDISIKKKLFIKYNTDTYEFVISHAGKNHDIYGDVFYKAKLDKVINEIPIFELYCSIIADYYLYKKDIQEITGIQKFIEPR